jgi:hypothetical protein
MINPDAPAFPVPLNRGETVGERGGAVNPNGLPIRCYMATMIAQGLASDGASYTDCGTLAMDAVDITDAILKKLGA